MCARMSRLAADSTGVVVTPLSVVDAHDVTQVPQSVQILLNNLTRHFMDYLDSAREDAESDAASVKALKCVAHDLDSSNSPFTQT